MLSGVSLAAQSVFRPPVSNLQQDQRPAQPGPTPPHADDSAAGTGPGAGTPVQPASETEKPKDESGARNAAGEALGEEEERQVRELKNTDAEVRAHEAAHAAAGGPYAGAPSFEFTTGPDGKRYVTSGEVEIDSAPVRDNPEATIRKMDIVIRAALSPAEPSSQDLAVARQAQAERTKAQAELTKQRAAERDANKGEASAEEGALRPPGQSDPLSGRIAEAAAAYAKTADNDSAAKAEELFAAALQLSIVA